MRSPMESVSAHVVLRVESLWQRVVERMGRHGLMEGSVKDCYLRHLGKPFPSHFDASQIPGIVKRSQRNHVPDFGRDLVGDKRGSRNASPPCTTLCPMPKISLRSHPAFGSEKKLMMTPNPSR